MQATNQDDFCDYLTEFTAPSNNPILLEAFTDKQKDIDILKGFRRMIYQDTPAMETATKLKNIPTIRKALDTNAGSKLKDGVKKILKI